MTDPVVVQPAEHDHRILVITLNRPDARNAINGAVARGLADAADELDRNNGLRVGVLTGAGRGFCAGMDLKGFLEGDFPSIAGRGFGGLTQTPPVKPLIAAIEGFAVAGGLEIALACDLIVASRDAKLGLPEVKRSLIAAGGGLLRLAQRIPYHIAAEVALTGDPVPAERLYEVGLLNRIVDPGDALTTALRLGSVIADNAPLALAGTKHILSNAGDWGLAAGWERQEPTAAAVAASEDAQEGSLAFAQRRAPQWLGR